MIIGGLSENLLLTILQRIEDLYREVANSRAEGTNANRLGISFSKYRLGISLSEHSKMTGDHIPA